MFDRAAPLPDDPARLKDMVASLAAKLQAREEALRAREEALRSRAEALKARDILIEKLRHELAGMRRHRFGARSEALAQLQLALENEEIARAASPPPQPEPAAARAPRRKRRPLPDRLPRRETVLEPGSACGACGGALKTVGTDITEELEYIPGRFVVNRIVRPRTICRACARFCQALLPPRPIERGRPGPGLLAHVPVSEYVDHLPLYRQAQMFARDGIDLDRSTLAEWVGKSAALLEPVANGIGNHVRAGGAIFADDTPVRLQTPRGAGARGKTRIARLWVYARDERPWRGTAPPAACYRFSANRKGENPRRCLAGFKGWMHADGYAGFAELYRTGRIREALCMAHVRRKFVDFARNRGAPVAREAIERIAALYAVEAEARGHTPEERVRIRQAKARPLLNDLETWLAQRTPNIPAGTPLAGVTATPAPDWPASARGSTTERSNLTTTPSNAPSAALPSDARTGSSSAPKPAAQPPQPHTRSSKPQNSTASTRAHGSQTHPTVSRTTNQPESTNSCRGTGNIKHRHNSPIAP